MSARRSQTSVHHQKSFASCDVVLPFEIGVRELPGVLLLAAELAARGASVVVGPKNHAITCLVDQGLSYRSYVYKFGTSQVFGGDRIRGYGQDPEAGLAFQSFQDFYRIQHGAFDKAVREGATYFAYGRDDYDFLTSTYGADYAVDLTGSPRAQMWRNPGNYFDHETNLITRKYGDLVLFCSTEAASSPANRRHSRPPHGLEADGLRSWFQDRRLSGEIWQSEVAAVSHLAKQHPNISIVVRPHPAESPRRWEDATKALRNVSVNKQYPVIAWIRAAMVTVQNGSTSALEAYCAGRPVINYAASTPYADSGEKSIRQMPRRVSQDAIGLCQLEDAVARMSTDAFRNPIDSKTDLLAGKLHWPEGGPARVIAGRIELAERDIPFMHARPARHLRCALGRDGDSKLHRISTRWVQSKLASLSSMLPESTRLRVRSLGHSSYLIESR